MAENKGNARGDAEQFGSSAASAAKTAGKAAKAARNRKIAKAAKAGKAASNAATMALKMKVMLIGLCIFLCIAVISSVLSLFPMSSSNIVLHQNDAENLSAESTILLSPSEDTNDDVKLMRYRYDEAKAALDIIIAEATNSAKSQIKSAADANDWIIDNYSSATPESNLLDYHYLTYISAYSASVGNGLSPEAFEMFMDTSSINDITTKVKALVSQPSKTFPYGNRIVGADFVRGGDGQVMVTEVTTTYTVDVPGESVSDYLDAGYEYADEGGAADSETGLTSMTVTITTYHVNISIYIASISEIAEDAFGIDMYKPYDDSKPIGYESETPEGDEEENEDDLYEEEQLPVIEGEGVTSYGDIIEEMAHTLGITLFGDDYWDNIMFLGGSFGFGAATGVIDIAKAEYEAYLDENGTPISWNGDKYLQALGYGTSADYPWDAAFVVWCIKQAGYGDNVIKKTASCSDLVGFFKSNDKWVDAADSVLYDAIQGQLLFRDYNGDGVADHVDIIVSKSNGTYSLIGGNTVSEGGAQTIAYTTISANDSTILGIGKPSYTIDGKYRGCDTCVRLNETVAKNLADYGLSYVGRYLGPESWSKACRPAEVEALHNAGLGVLFFYEVEANAFNQGAPMGTQHGRAALAICQEMNIPKNVIIYFCVDAVVENWPNMRAYFEAAKTEMAKGGYKIGFYGSFSCVEDMYSYDPTCCAAYYQCSGGSYGKVSGRANCFQWVQWDPVSLEIKAASRSYIDFDAGVCTDLAAAGVWMP